MLIVTVLHYSQRYQELRTTQAQLKAQEFFTRILQETKSHNISKLKTNFRTETFASILHEKSFQSINKTQTKHKLKIYSSF